MKYYSVLHMRYMCMCVCGQAVCVFLQENISDYIFKCNTLVSSCPPKIPVLHHPNMTTAEKEMCTCADRIVADRPC